MALKRENLCRASNDITVDRSAAPDGSIGTLRGHFAVWNQWTPIRSQWENGGRPFLERFATTSMDKTLAENPRGIKVMFNHGKDPNIGEKLLGVPESVAPDREGAAYAVPLFDTSYNRDLVPGIDAGAYGASFRFSVMQEDYVERPSRSEYNPEGIPERTVLEARVMEFGPVSYPAYEGATAGMRSVTDEFLAAQLFEDPERAALIMRAIGREQTAKQTYTVSFNGANVTAGADTRASSAEDDAAALKVLNEEIAADEAADRADEPEPSAATTHTEPEPPEATTRSHTDLFWFVTDPKLKGAKTK